MFQWIVKSANKFVSIVTALALLIAGAYAGYCLWDNQQIYSAAQNVQAELLKLKPSETGDGKGPSFDEILRINPDVRAWVTLDNTKIDYPVLQGKSNVDYLNRDVYGRFALAGSIFLDSRNNPHFKDTYSVLYGHHMDRSAMFGDLDKYLDAEFFKSNHTGTLMIPGKVFSLEVFAAIQTVASNENIFAPGTWNNDVPGLLAFAKKNSIHIREDIINTIKKRLDKNVNVKILALTTCSSDFTDARTIVLAAMTEKIIIQ